MKIYLVLILVLTFSFSAFGQINFSIKKFWTGYDLQNELKSAAPEKEFITDQSSWKRLWKAWRANESLPKVNFRRQAIVFCTTTSPNDCSFFPNLKRGNLQLNAITTAMLGKTDRFSYRIALINRTGIKTINGKPIVSK